MVNSEESPGVVFLLSFFARHIFAQEVECLVSAMARHLLTAHHLQQREEDRFQVFGCICRDHTFFKSDCDTNKNLKKKHCLKVK